MREYILERGNISSTANSYVCVARVSKLKGLSMRVIGNSFRISIKATMKALIRANLLIGKWTFCNKLNGPNPRFLPVSSIVSGCFSRLDWIGDFPTAKNLITYANNKTPKVPTNKEPLNNIIRLKAMTAPGRAYPSDIVLLI